MGAVDLQLDAARAVEAYIDASAGGPGSGWVQNRRIPAQARAIVEQGNLAVVLGIEIDFLFDCRADDSFDEAELSRRLDSYYRRRVRHLFPILFSDNGLGGTALQNSLIRSKQRRYDPAVNPPRGMMIDVDHMSLEESKRDSHNVRGSWLPGHTWATGRRPGRAGRLR